LGKLLYIVNLPAFFPCRHFCSKIKF